MALFKRLNPKGIDVVIDTLQRDLFIELTKKFGWKQYDCYDRAYRNRKGADKLPEVCTDGEEYKEVLFDDKLTVTSFFLAEESRRYNSEKFTYEQGVSMIFQANLSNLFPTVKHRPDEELIDNVIKAINNKFWENRLVEVVTGIEKVYESLKVNIDQEYVNDMGGYAMARFNFKMLYTNGNCKIQVLK